MMQQVMRQKLKKQNQIIKAALTGQHEGQKDGARGIQMMETRIYVGLNDAAARVQLFETDTYLNILKDVCRSYHVAFSVDVEEGGYYHEDGEYTEETSLVLVLIDVDRDTVQGIAQDLRTRFHQESVLVTENNISGFFIGEGMSD